jgi:hypothetical protein
VHQPPQEEDGAGEKELEVAEDQSMLTQAELQQRLQHQDGRQGRWIRMPALCVSRIF